MKKIVISNKHIIKQNKGITLTALVVTIIILLILAGVGISVGKDSIESAKLMSYGTELQAMQNKVNELEQELQRKIKSNDNDEVNKIKNIGQNLQGNEQESTAFAGAEESDTSGYRYYDKNTVEDLGFKNFNSEFLINVEKRKVILLYGIEYKGKTIWTAEQLEGNNQYNVDYAGVESIVTFDLGVQDNGVLVSNIQHTGNVKKSTIYYGQGAKENDVKWKVAKKDTIENSCKIDNIYNDGIWYVKVEDSAGHSSIKTINVKRQNSILKEITTDYLALREGDTVYYKDANNNDTECTVLYDSQNTNYSSYGVQIIPRNPVTTVTLGKNDNAIGAEGMLGTFDRAKWSYNNAINSLNVVAQNYVLTNQSLVEIASDSRCVGSLPSNPSAQNTTMYTNNYDYFSSYNNQFKSPESDKSYKVNNTENYTVDKVQLDSLEIATITDTTNGSAYWLASRYARGVSEDTVFLVRFINSSGNSDYNRLCGVTSGGSRMTYDFAHGLRPCITINFNIKVTETNGKKYINLK